jgi:hypothetical protein
MTILECLHHSKRFGKNTACFFKNDNVHFSLTFPVEIRLKTPSPSYNTIYN